MYGGQRWPDIVGALHFKQGWGEAQVSGVIHDVNVDYNGFDGAAGVRGVRRPSRDRQLQPASKPRWAGASTRA